MTPNLMYFEKNCILLQLGKNEEISNLCLSPKQKTDVPKPKN